MTRPGCASASFWFASLLTLAACGAQPAAAPLATSATTLTSTETTGAASTPTVPATTAAVTSRHPSHDELAAALPVTADLTWLPSSAQPADDSDLTTRLDLPECGGQSTRLASRESSATNRAFDDAGQRLAEVTYYDAETPDDAHRFIAAIADFFSCPAPANAAARTALISLREVAATGCDEAVATRTRQPVSETIDAWCRVGNLIAWIRLDPTGPATGTGVAAPGDTGLVPAPGENLTPPTDDNANATVIVVGKNLRALFGTAS